jgi:hypothetical protein
LHSKIDGFRSKVPDFAILSDEDRVDVLIYYLTEVEHQISATSRDIETAAEDGEMELGIYPYEYILDNLQPNGVGMRAKFLRSQGGFVLRRFRKKEIRKLLAGPSE